MFASTGDQTQNHQVMSLTRSPLSRPGRTRAGETNEVSKHRSTGLPCAILTALPGSACSRNHRKIVSFANPGNEKFWNIVGKGENTK